MTNVDWSIYLRLKRLPLVGNVSARLMGPLRKSRFETLPDNILVHNLAKGIPFADGSVDVVYHSHLLEHLDRSVAPKFMAEVRRVLRPGGIQRIVVPDLERLCRECLEHLERCGEPDERARHGDLIAALIEQSVRRKAFGTRGRSGPIVMIENLLVGDARRRGETHQWMYDWANLRALLEETGFAAVETLDYERSGIPDWNDLGLDRTDDGGPYKPGSLYVEARRLA